MSGTATQVIENSYFSIKQASRGPDDVVYWDLMRKAPLLGNAAPELLELLAGILASGDSENRILLPMRDHALFQDLQVVGCAWIGYAVSKPSGAGGQWDLWGPPGTLAVVPANSIETALSADDQRFERIVVQVHHELGHDPRWGVREYLDFVRSRERYFSGLSETDYLKSRALWKSPQALQGPVKPEGKKRKITVRVVPQFADVVSKRVSAPTFNTSSIVDNGDLDLIFRDSYYQRPDGHYPVATAGGLGSFRIWVVSAGADALSEVCCTVDAQSRAWQPRSNTVRIQDLFQATSAQEMFESCRTWLVIEADLQPLSEKYGNRAYRFATMGAGALIQALHLSCTSYGIKFRAVGGFDDGMLERLFDLPGNGYRRILALAGLAK